ncbi:MAG: hypothetical protein J0L77_07570 [Alphaproteobacteria bacterium]|nr:hypothetical protein [Alphaproteobacteria bacterium]
MNNYWKYILVSLCILVVLGCQIFCVVYIIKQQAGSLGTPLPTIGTPDEAVSVPSDPMSYVRSQGKKISGGGTYFKPFIFAVVGQTCPPFSDLYEGPEQYEAQKNNFTYCLFFRHSFSILASENKACPEGSKEYKHPGELSREMKEKYIYCHIE